MACLTLVDEQFLVFLKKFSIEEEEARNLLGKDMMESSVPFLGTQGRCSFAKHHGLDVVLVARGNKD